MCSYASVSKGEANSWTNIHGLRMEGRSHIHIFLYKKKKTKIHFLSSATLINQYFNKLIIHTHTHTHLNITRTQGWVQFFVRSTYSVLESCSCHWRSVAFIYKTELHHYFSQYLYFILFEQWILVWVLICTRIFIFICLLHYVCIVLLIHSLVLSLCDIVWEFGYCERIISDLHFVKGLVYSVLLLFDGMELIFCCLFYFVYIFCIRNYKFLVKRTKRIHIHTFV